MAEEKLIVIHGAGVDSIGLVERITNPIADIGGNIVDLRQDVLHGLFVIYLVVDLAESNTTVGEFANVLGAIRESTDLELSYKRFRPVPRDPEKKGLLCILIGDLCRTSRLFGKDSPILGVSSLTLDGYIKTCNGGFLLDEGVKI